LPLDLTAVGERIGPLTSNYGWKDLVLYALGVGAGFGELEYVFENRLKAIPSFAAALVFRFFFEVAARAGVNPAGILHAEHDLTLHAPVPVEGGTLTTEARIIGIYDKGANKGALVTAEADTWGSEGRRLFTNAVTVFARLDGGFGGQDLPRQTFFYPERAPDFQETAHPSPDQPLIYRLSGDTFALHVDPEFARASGFDRPIMHGLCMQGYACRAMIMHLFPGEPERLTRLRVRFARPLYPGVPITTQIWQIGEGRALFRTLNAATGEVVLGRGEVEWGDQEEARRRAGGVVASTGGRTS